MIGLIFLVVSAHSRLDGPRRSNVEEMEYKGKYLRTMDMEPSGVEPVVFLEEGASLMRMTSRAEERCYGSDDGRVLQTVPTGSIVVYSDDRVVCVVWER